MERPRHNRWLIDLEGNFAAKKSNSAPLDMKLNSNLSF
jgi:hypothetical protein